MSIQPDSRKNPSILLLRASLHQRGQSAALVTSNSMAPLLRRGDKIIIDETQGVSLQTGDLVVVQMDQDLIAHRFWGTYVAGDKHYLISKGDRLENFDPLMPESSLVGRVVSRVRNQKVTSLLDVPGSIVNRMLFYLLRLEARMTGQSPLKNSRVHPKRIEKAKFRPLGRKFIHRIFYYIARLSVLFIEPFAKNESV